MDRARFAKAQSYMVRRDDPMGCKNIRCRKRFDVVGIQSVADSCNEARRIASSRIARAEQREFLSLECILLCE